MASCTINYIGQQYEATWLLSCVSNRSWIHFELCQFHYVSSLCGLKENIFIFWLENDDLGELFLVKSMKFQWIAWHAQTWSFLHLLFLKYGNTRCFRKIPWIKAKYHFSCVCVSGGKVWAYSHMCAWKLCMDIMNFHAELKTWMNEWILQTFILASLSLTFLLKEQHNISNKFIRYIERSKIVVRVGNHNSWAPWLQKPPWDVGATHLKQFWLFLAKIITTNTLGAHKIQGLD
jgi:hypothetical protein